MKHVCIIQARMGSTRLPGKILKDLSGQSVLQHVIERVKRSILIDEVVVATTTKSEDDVVVKLCMRLGVNYYRGDELDVLARYLGAAKEYGADIIIRVTSDCPLIDPEIIDAVIRLRRKKNADYASLSGPRSYPRGLDNEVFTMESFKIVAEKAKEPYERVHVTPYYYLHENEFKIAHVNQDVDYSDFRWTLDTPEDYEALTAIYDGFGGRNDMGWKDVLDYVVKHPKIIEINSHISQKKLEDL